MKVESWEYNDFFLVIIDGNFNLWLFNLSSFGIFIVGDIRNNTLWHLIPMFMVVGRDTMPPQSPTSNFRIIVASPLRHKY